MDKRWSREEIDQFARNSDFNIACSIIRQLRDDLAESRKKIEVMETERKSLKDLVDAIGEADAVDIGRVYEINCADWEEIKKLAGWRD